MGRARGTQPLADTFWFGKTVAVTGATGFLGGWLVRRLLELEATVLAVARDPERPSQLKTQGMLPQVTVAAGSMDDGAFLERTFASTRLDAVFHTASMADINVALGSPLACFRSNALGTWHLLDILRREQPACVTIVSSSDKAYGVQPVPYRESHPLTPVHPYEVTKATQDLSAQSFGKVYGLPVAVTRCGNFFGPFDYMSSRLVPGVCRALARGERPRLRSDGLFTRDFFYVEDAAEAQLLLAERLAVDPSLKGEAFNFSYGAPISVFDLVQKLMSLSGVTGTPIVEDRTHGEIRHMHLSSRKARTVLGWKPSVGMQQGLRRTVDWYLNREEGTSPATGGPFPSRSRDRLPVA